MHLWPSSNSERLREYNQCHSPEDGKFCSGGGSKAFMEELHKSPVNPLNNREALLSTTDKWSGAYAAVEAFAVGDDRVRLQFVRSLAKRQGYGRRAMEVLTGMADRHGVTLEGFAKPVGTDGLKKAQLFEFYRKFGFTVAKSGDMVREPKGVK